MTWAWKFSIIEKTYVDRPGFYGLLKGDKPTMNLRKYEHDPYKLVSCAFIYALLLARVIAYVMQKIVPDRIEAYAKNEVVAVLLGILWYTIGIAMRAFPFFVMGLGALRNEIRCLVIGPFLQAFWIVIDGVLMLVAGVDQNKTLAEFVDKDPVTNVIFTGILLIVMIFSLIMKAIGDRERRKNRLRKNID